MKEILFAKYNRERRQEFQIATIIYEENGIRRVEKKPLNKKAAEHVLRLRENTELVSRTLLHVNMLLPEMENGRAVYPFAEGMTVETKLQEQNNDLERLIASIKEVNRYLYAFREEYLEKFCPDEKIREIFGEVPALEQTAVRNVSLDMMYDNLILSGEGLLGLDCEWVLDRAVPVRYLEYRNVFYYYIRYHLYLGRRIPLTDFLQRFDFTEDEIRIYGDMESHFQEYVFGSGHACVYEDRYKKENQKLSLAAYDGLVEEGSKKTQKIRELETCCEQIQNNLRQYQDENEDLQRERQKMQEELQRLSKDIQYLNTLVEDKNKYIESVESYLAALRKNPLYQAMHLLSKPFRR